MNLHMLLIFACSVQVCTCDYSPSKQAPKTRRCCLRSWHAKRPCLKSSQSKFRCCYYYSLLNVFFQETYQNNFDSIKKYLLLLSAIRSKCFWCHSRVQHFSVPPHYAQPLKELFLGSTSCVFAI